MTNEMMQREGVPRRQHVNGEVGVEEELHDGEVAFKDVRVCVCVSGE